MTDDRKFGGGEPTYLPPSVRNGLSDEPLLLGPADLPNRLRTGLFNAFHEHFDARLSVGSEAIVGCLNYAAWTRGMGKAADEMPHASTTHFLKHTKRFFAQAKGWEVVDFVEFLALELRSALELLSALERREASDAGADNWEERANDAFLRARAPWRFRDGQLVPLGSPHESKSVLSAISAADGHAALANCAVHLRASVAGLRNARYPEAAGQAVSAVESLAKVAVGRDDSFGKLAGDLAKRANVSPAITGAFSKLFGWASESGGARHGLSPSDDPMDFDEARFLVVTASAFVNLLIPALDRSGGLTQHAGPTTSPTSGNEVNDS